MEWWFRVSEVVFQEGRKEGRNAMAMAMAKASLWKKGGLTRLRREALAQLQLP
jgi:hypothetical protein